MFSQLFYDGHSTIASSLATLVNADPPCSPSDRLMHVVAKGLQHETDRQKESEQLLTLNPIQQMLIGPGLGMFNKYITHIQMYIYLFTLN